MEDEAVIVETKMGETKRVVANGWYVADNGTLNVAMADEDGSIIRVVSSINAGAWTICYLE